MPMTSRERLAAALSHRQPDRVPVDFNGTAVTGMHVKCVIALRDHYGLEKRLVKVHEPYQMLGWIDDDLQVALGIDVEGVYGRRHDVRLPQRELDALAHGRRDRGPHVRQFSDDQGRERRHPRLPQRRPDRAALRPPAEGRLLLRHHHPPGADRRGQARSGGQPRGVRPDWPKPTSTTSRSESRRAGATGRGVIATFGGTALGDIALVPGPIPQASEGHPGRRGVVRLDPDPPGLRPQGLRAADRDRPGQPGEDRAPGRRRASRPSSSAARTSAPRRRPSARWPPSASSICPITGGSTTGSTPTRAWKTFKHSCGAGSSLHPGLHRDRIRHPQSGPGLGRGHGRPTSSSSEFGRDIVFWGGGVDTQKTLMFGTPAEVRDEVLRALRDLSGATAGSSSTPSTTSRPTSRWPTSSPCSKRWASQRMKKIPRNYVRHLRHRGRRHRRPHLRLRHGHHRRGHPLPQGAVLAQFAFGEGLAVSIVLVGCMIGAGLAGRISDRLGRRRFMLVSAVLFLVSAVGCALPQNLTQFLVFRFIGGLAIGSASDRLAALHLRDRAAPDPGRPGLGQPAGHRHRHPDRLLRQLVFVGAGPANWRWMFATGAIPAVFFFLLVLRVPESPRWLIKQGPRGRGPDRADPGRQRRGRRPKHPRHQGHPGP